MEHAILDFKNGTQIPGYRERFTDPWLYATAHTSGVKLIHKGIKDKAKQWSQESTYNLGVVEGTQNLGYPVSHPSLGRCIA